MKTIALIAAVVLSVAGSAAAQSTPDLAGTWQLSVTTSRGVTEATLTLEKAGDKYTGSVATPEGSVPAEATLKEKAVTILVTAQRNGAPVTFTLAGTLDGDAISGTAASGGGDPTPFTARRGAAAAGAGTASALDVSGTWALEVTSSQGTGTPTFTFKQDGEKLSGQYKGMLGEAPITGTLKGSAIEFTGEVPLEGNKVRFVYKGTVEKDAMKGTVTLGDLGEGTFKGTRKP